MNSNSNAAGGLSLSSVLLVVFVVLKLTDLIDWSWWWVLSPLWISFAVYVVIGAVLGVAKEVRRR